MCTAPLCSAGPPAPSAGRGARGRHGHARPARRSRAPSQPPDRDAPPRSAAAQRRAGRRSTSSNCAPTSARSVLSPARCSINSTSSSYTVGTWIPSRRTARCSARALRRYRPTCRRATVNNHARTSSSLRPSSFAQPLNARANVSAARSAASVTSSVRRARKISTRSISRAYIAVKSVSDPIYSENAAGPKSCDRRRRAANRPGIGTRSAEGSRSPVSGRAPPSSGSEHVLGGLPDLFEDPVDTRRVALLEGGQLTSRSRSRTAARVARTRRGWSSRPISRARRTARAATSPRRRRRAVRRSARNHSSSRRRVQPERLVDRLLERAPDTSVEQIPGFGRSAARRSAIRCSTCHRPRTELIERKLDRARLEPCRLRGVRGDAPRQPSHRPQEQ